MYEFGLGPRIVPMNVCINVYKCLIPFITVFMMLSHQNYSNAMFIYLLFQMVYSITTFIYIDIGFICVLKNVNIPERAMKHKVTIGSVLVIWITGIGSYMIPAYQIATKEIDNSISFERQWTSLLIFICGIVILIISETQKYYTLLFEG